MEINISNEQLNQSGISESEMRIELACLFFRLGVLSSGKAATFASISHVEMLAELAKRKIPLNDSIEHFQESLKNLRNLGNDSSK
jgi:predicted HTH domain antitoxin